jgi:hypothetical protein
MLHVCVHGHVVRLACQQASVSIRADLAPSGRQPYWGYKCGGCKSGSGLGPLASNIQMQSVKLIDARAGHRGWMGNVCGMCAI